VLVNPEELVESLGAEIVKRMGQPIATMDYTAFVKGHIANLYSRAGGDTRCTGRGGEFLVDLCAFAGPRMELVLESEWRLGFLKSRKTSRSFITSRRKPKS
jgi:hypothetical protein